MSAWTQEEVKQAVEKVKELSVKDAGFRKLCLEAPGTAVKKATGKDIPDGIVIKFIENEGAHVTVVLPDAPVLGEVSDDDLDSVSGGTQQMGLSGRPYPED
jgi:hypothetical protein